MDFTEDIARRARWAIKHNDGIPNPAWSTGERLFTALVLRDERYLAAEEWTVAEVTRRLAGELGVTSIAEAGAWVQGIRDALEVPGDG